MPRHPLRAGVDGALGHDVKRGLELLLTARPDLDPRWHHPLGSTREGAAKHVLERFEPGAPPGQHGADRGAGQMGQLDLHRGTAGGEGLLDFIESGRIRHAAETEPRDLVSYGEPCPAKLATPPATGITNPAVPARRRGLRRCIGR